MEEADKKEQQQTTKEQELSDRESSIATKEREVEQRLAEAELMSRAFEAIHFNRIRLSDPERGPESRLAGSDNQHNLLAAEIEANERLRTKARFWPLVCTRS